MSKYGNINNILDNYSKTLEQDYYKKFMCAYVAFRYSKVFDPNENKLVNLNFMEMEELSSLNSFDYYAIKICLKYKGSLDFLGNEYPRLVAK